jgi:integrase
LQYLQNKISKKGELLYNSSVNRYFIIFSAVIRFAIDEKLISDNPLRSIKLLKEKKSEKIFLTLAELRLLAKTDCKQKELKRAFMFSCLTGLRWSDVYKLSWGKDAMNSMPNIL